MSSPSNLRRSAANSARKSESLLAVLNSLFERNSGTTFVNKQEMMNVVQGQYDTAILRNVSRQIVSSIQILKSYKELVDNEKRRLETLEKVCLFHNILIVSITNNYINYLSK